MIEILLSFLLPIILLPQIAAGLLAKQLGRKFWFWFLISFLIPIISLIVLLMLKDKNSNPQSSENIV
ncbi:hypothetical protein [Pedobacter africanus]|uniref:hypothetical protein n=1 Tax=Pedobacter africanus TaxID=151894 RepID=UPI00286A710E|nr:hypothetical protein [Pedobacter africanus]